MSWMSLTLESNQKALSFSLVVKQLLTLQSHWLRQVWLSLVPRLLTLTVQRTVTFEQALKDLDIPQPPGQTATNEEEAVLAARKIGFPVLVRPSYVLGGRAMEIVENEDDLRSYMRTAVKGKSRPSSSCRLLYRWTRMWSWCHLRRTKCPHPRYHGAYRTCWCPLQVTPWLFILHKPCLKRFKNHRRLY